MHYPNNNNRLAVGRFAIPLHQTFYLDYTRTPILDQIYHSGRVYEISPSQPA